MGLLLPGSPVSPKRNLYLYGMNDEQLQMIMLDIDGVLTRHHATASSAASVRRGSPASSAAPSSVARRFHRRNRRTLKKAPDGLHIHRGLYSYSSCPHGQKSNEKSC